MVIDEDAAMKYNVRYVGAVVGVLSCGVSSAPCVNMRELLEG